ncbi:T9SS type A sorting domain-containing protein [Rufibacter glacialis]|uniref:T9SS type A sorting domain-containing protein n=1 Tax=Rufibacter glacialis TaxID=1259555 RepID=A0A5M8Q517_9BACT|nr:T9SS type A sorting domain-containing protein [Rufibacter glacialis]KAA6430965.1 T9SS type A sorting domain-containing protein [Rufibacter glacialis]GGK82910.1 hypothetical protein GCM10011405_33400 [Rufibacter glacialis]
MTRIPVLCFIVGVLLSYAGHGQAIDPAFHPKIERGAEIYSITKLSEGKVLVAGNFERAEGQEAPGLVKLGADGKVDASFKLVGAQWSINDLVTVEQKDKRLLVGGPIFPTPQQPNIGICRLLQDGSLDNTFTSPVASGSVSTILEQADGKIIIGGSFTLKGNTTLKNMARLLSNGTLDNTFQVAVGANQAVKVIREQPDGKLLVGGDFTQFENAVTYRKLIRLSSAGAVDATFGWANLVHEANGVVDLLLLPDGRILFATKQKRSSADTGYIGLGCLNGSGAQATSFENPFSPTTGSVSGNMLSLALQDGKVLVGGTLINKATSAAVPVVRITADGLLDNSFLQVTSSGAVICRSLAVQADNSILMGGAFDNFSGVHSNGINLLGRDGGLQVTFVPDLRTRGWVRRVLVQKDAKIIIAGDFDFVNNTRITNAARLLPNGSVDASFDFGHLFQGTSPNLAIQEDKIILPAPAGGTLMRIGYDGREDASFIKLPITAVNALAVTPDGKIMVAGLVNGKRFVRLQANGTLDQTFEIDPTIRFPAQTMSVQADGKVVVGRRDPTTTTTTTTIYPTDLLFRLTTHGALDNSFHIGTGPANDVNNALHISTVVAEPNGTLLVTGQFESFSGNTTSATGGIVRLHENGSFLAPFTVPGTDLNFVYDVAREAAGSYLLATYYFGGTSRALVRVSATPLATGKETAPALTSIYPNPFAGTLNVSLKERRSNNYEIRVLSLHGRELYKGIYQNPEFSLPLSLLTNGVYLLETSANGKRETRRIIKISQ